MENGFGRAEAYRKTKEVKRRTKDEERRTKDEGQKTRDKRRIRKPETSFS